MDAMDTIDTTDLDGLPQEYRDMVETVVDRQIFAGMNVPEGDSPYPSGLNRAGWRGLL